MQGAPRPDRRGWITAAIIGALLLLGGNGAVTWAEQRVTSSVAALLIATEPLWIMLLDWLRPQGTRPTIRTIIAIMLGFGGVAILVNPAQGIVSGVDAVGVTLILLAALSWAVGSLYARRAHLPASGAQASGMQMLAGGGLLGLMSLMSGEMTTFDVNAVSLRSLFAFGYLVVFGSLIAFSAYGWLVKNTTPTWAATYAYVNPMVAVLLGWGLANEVITAYTLLATVTITASVVLVTSVGNRQRADAGVPSVATEPGKVASEAG
jgi:drug/metabolite transporter (DMT)-like permease